MKLAHSPYFSTISICSVDMYVYARLDEIPLMTLQDSKETLSMHKQKPLRITKGNNPHRIDSWPLLFYHKYLPCIYEGICKV